MKKKYIMITLIFIISCKSKYSLSDKYGKINPNDVVRLEYFKHHINEGKPNCIITNKKEISEILKEINISNNPIMCKSIHWKQIKIIKKDTTLIFYLDENKIGTNHISGEFFELKNKDFIKKYFEKELQ